MPCREVLEPPYWNCWKNTASAEPVCCASATPTATSPRENNTSCAPCWALIRQASPLRFAAFFHIHDPCRAESYPPGCPAALTFDRRHTCEPACRTTRRRLRHPRH